MTHGDQHKAPPRSIAEMERDIARTREQLGGTIEELAAKADVPARAKAKAADTAARVRATFHRGNGTAGPVHEAAVRAGAKANRVSEDQVRNLYALAALSLTAATVVAVMWAKRNGDFDPESYRRPS